VANRTLGRPSARSSGELLEGNILFKMESFLVKTGGAITRAPGFEGCKRRPYGTNLDIIEKELFGLGERKCVGVGSGFGVLHRFFYRPITGDRIDRCGVLL
jgi:hypothetical protein